jgi:hypothetical protein
VNLLIESVSPKSNGEKSNTVRILACDEYDLEKEPNAFDEKVDELLSLIENKKVKIFWQYKIMSCLGLQIC